MKVLTTVILDELSSKAAASPRKRMNFNVHSSMDEPVHRMFNAIEPGTYVRPQRHSEPATFETVLVVRGAAVLLLFDDSGKVLERVDLSPEGPDFGFDIPPGVWHTIAALKPGTVFFEVKQGPYLPCPEQHLASWAPAEVDADAPVFEKWYHGVQTGSVPPSRRSR